jgi:hypothetical protein
LLIVGADDFTGAIVDILRPSLPAPLHTCDLPGALALPTDQSGTFLLRNVDRLGADQQYELFRWLDENDGFVQVVSVSATPLFSHVERGNFDERLYYRLNTVLEDEEGLLASIGC